MRFCLKKWKVNLKALAQNLYRFSLRFYILNSLKLYYLLWSRRENRGKSDFVVTLMKSDISGRTMKIFNKSPSKNSLLKRGPTRTFGPICNSTLSPGADLLNIMHPSSVTAENFDHKCKIAIPTYSDVLRLSFLLCCHASKRNIFKRRASLRVQSSESKFVLLSVWKTWNFLKIDVLGLTFKILTESSSKHFIFFVTS